MQWLSAGRRALGSRGAAGGHKALCPARRQILRHTAATWLMQRGVPVWRPQAFWACLPRCYWARTATIIPTSCTARQMPLHPSTAYRWLNRWLTLIALGKEGKKPNDYLVGVAGFEPATPASRTQCSTGLSHTPTRTRLIALGFAHRKNPDRTPIEDLNPMIVGLTTQMIATSPAAVADAARCLKQGGLVAFPTETVYGLGADASNAGAVARLYWAKGRPSFNPLIAHVGDLKAARQIGHFDALALALADAFWPGPLTLVLPKVPGCTVADLATAGLDTIALRVPAHPVAQALLRAFGGAVVAPSANLSGHGSPTTAAHVQSDLAGRIDIILDGGAVAVGLESTIIGCFDAPMLLRPGGLPS